MKKTLFFVFLLLLCLARIAFAGQALEVIYPYSLDSKNDNRVYTGSTVPLFFDIVSHDDVEVRQARIRIVIPEGFRALEAAEWQLRSEGGRMIAEKDVPLDDNYGRAFGILYLKAPEQAPNGSYSLEIDVTSSAWQEHRKVDFELTAAVGETGKSAGAKADGEGGKKPAVKDFNWYIQGVTFPVDANGEKDLRAASGILYVKDTSLEGFRNRMTGGGATNWSAVFNHPAAFLRLEMRNPQRDVRLLKFKAQLIDKKTGEPAPGLVTAGTVAEDGEHGWAGASTEKYGSTAVISLDGKKSQEFVLPIYVDFFNILEGEYNLRVTTSGNGQEKIQELPVTIAKKHSFGIFSVSFAGFCFLLVLFFSGHIRRTIDRIGAKGAITVALFAAIAFGGITLPTTILGDLLHVFMGPFSGLVTGLLSGVLQYLLIMALLILFRTPGVLSLMFLIKFLLAGLMFGHFSPVGILSCCASIAVLEAALYCGGFYAAQDIGGRYVFFISILLGLADAFITFVNLQQMMFFYRLYYADWYLALYMLINGLLYSSVGALLGYKTGRKLKQVMGE